MNPIKKPGAVASLLDSIILASHSIRVAGRKVHPYLLMFNCGVIAAVLFIYWYAQRSAGIVFEKFLAVFLVVFFLYEFVFARLKAKVLNSASRSYLQDLLFLVPAALLFFKIFGVPVAAGLDLIGLFLPLLIAWTRLGCFLGGCCYGIPCRFGPVYPPEVFVPYRLGCQKYSPGQATNERVFPIQLVESAVNLLLWIVLLHYEVLLKGKVLPVYLLSYCFYRFFSDFLRSASARHKIGVFSQAQIFAIIFVCACLIWIWGGRL